MRMVKPQQATRQCHYLASLDRRIVGHDMLGKRLQEDKDRRTQGLLDLGVTIDVGWELAWEDE
jgi:hypothetical protein